MRELLAKLGAKTGAKTNEKPLKMRSENPGTNREQNPLKKHTKWLENHEFFRSAPVLPPLPLANATPQPEFHD